MNLFMKEPMRNFVALNLLLWFVTYASVRVAKTLETPVHLKILMIHLFGVYELMPNKIISSPIALSK